MIVTAREFKTVAEMMAHARAVHARCFNGLPKQMPVRVKVDPVADTGTPPDLRPLWMIRDIRFDAHCRSKEWHLAQAASNRIRDFIRNRCDELGVEYDDIMGWSKSPKIVVPRQQLMLEVREAFGTSYPDIGRFFGGRDHSTIIHGANRAKARRQASGQTK